MRKNILGKSLVLSTLLFSTSYASEKNFIELGLGLSDSLNSFNYQDNVNDKTKSNTSSFTSIQFAYNLELDDKKNAYAKMLYGQMNLGLTYILDKGKLDLGFSVDLGAQNEWRDPFNTVENEGESEVSEKGIYIGYSLPLTQNIYSTFKYTRTYKEYEDDQVHADLKRDGTKQNIRMENMYKNYLVNFNYEIYDANGKSSSYKILEFEGGKVYTLSKKMTLIALGNIGTIKYDETNPVLNEQIDGTIYGAKFNLKYKEPYSFKNSYISVVTGYEKTQANNSFYDKKNKVGMVSIGYTF